MSPNQPRVITLTEYEPVHFAPEEIPAEVGKILFRHYPNQVEVEFPTPKTEGRWQLRSLGWIGHIPLTPDLHLALLPKVPLENVFSMLEYAYRLKFDLLPELVHCQSLAEFYERLAHVLALRVLDRGRKGFYRAYLAQAERLPYVRGRLDVQPAAQRPGQVKLPCQYEEHTVNIADNQILAWTLYYIAHSGMCTERVLPAVRQAYRTLQNLVTAVPHGPQACIDRPYHRLNEDYRPLHALCRFFLDQSGPTHQLGDQTMLPFLVDMASLYELFVAEWLKSQLLPAGLTVTAQEPVEISQDHRYHIDLVLSDNATGATRCVLDTKYKAPDKPSNDDINQVTAYATVKACNEAILIYPASLVKPLAAKVGDIRVRSLTFSLAGDLEQAGQTFLQALLQPMPVNH